MSVAHLRIVSTPADTMAEANDASLSDEQVVARLYQGHKDLVFRIGLRYGRGDRTWAEDLTHDVFIDLFRDVDRVRALDNPHAWLYRVATNRCLDRLKSERRRRRLTAVAGNNVSPRGRSGPEEILLESARLRRALQFVDALEPEWRACFYMHHVDALPQKEIAAVLGRSPSNICRILKRIEKRLNAAEREVEDG